MSRQNILNKGSVMEKLTKLRSLPTLQNVMQGYYWRQNELKAGKGPNYNPTISEVLKSNQLYLKSNYIWMLLSQLPEARGPGAEPPALENFAFFCKNNFILGLF